MSDNASDPLLDFARAIVDSRYRRPQRPEPEQTLPEHWTDEDRRRYQLAQMLDEALNPQQPEPTWQQQFPRRTDLTAELFGSTEH